MAKSYKHAASVSGQLYFCAAPIRLDAYDGCQFGCVYCFSRKRSRVWADAGAHEASTTAFERRLKRVARGDLASALDEFLAARVPLQLGGLHDPFSPKERERGITKALLLLLHEAKYPTLISTKGDLAAEPDYVAILRNMNVVVRFSAAGVSEKYRQQIDRRCGDFDNTLRKIAVLSQQGIPTGLRIQPVIPGFEEDALAMTRRAAEAGVRQVSFEYLKLPYESLRSDIAIMSKILGFDLGAKMKALGTASVGWDYALSAKAKLSFVVQARKTCRALKVVFGAGDTEFIPWSDGDGCCGSSSRFLEGSTQFQANFVGAIKSALAQPKKLVVFAQLWEAWSPKRPVSTYLNRESRGASLKEGYTDWMALMSKRWNKGTGPYSPQLFFGVRPTSRTNGQGYQIYDASDLSRILAQD